MLWFLVCSCWHRPVYVVGLSVLLLVCHVCIVGLSVLLTFLCTYWSASIPVYVVIGLSCCSWFVHVVVGMFWCYRIAFFVVELSVVAGSDGLSDLLVCMCCCWLNYAVNYN